MFNAAPDDATSLPVPQQSSGSRLGGDWAEERSDRDPLENRRRIVALAQGSAGESDDENGQRPHGWSVAEAWPVNRRIEWALAVLSLAAAILVLLAGAWLMPFDVRPQMLTAALMALSLWLVIGLHPDR
ncbi:hypothetical protein E2493_06185 [Sphingomonas parva]|uniref:Uncharacterized protein n=1 Tax=Sphingomonas parva TaxID=2555898 RepID=A0A4Y8ZSX0_9SPHN|nr:hypothetical protein [Sphingomonas parva]TFI59111.1 hypothetical protein E2493_06185 [Sphingomonas parva]